MLHRRWDKLEMFLGIMCIVTANIKKSSEKEENNANQKK